MRADEFRHLKHRNLLLAAKNDLELVIRIDHPFIGGVLQIVLLDVSPDFLGDFRAWCGRGANHGTQGGDEP